MRASFALLRWRSAGVVGPKRRSSKYLPLLNTPTQNQCFYAYKKFLGYLAKGKVERNPAFSAITTENMEYFENVLGRTNVIKEGEALHTYNMDWTGHYEGASKLVLKPGTTEEVSKILSYCNDRTLPVVPQGGIRA